MTKLITTKKWQCTLCGKTFSTQKEASDCEKNKPGHYPVGCVHTYWEEGFAEDTLAVACNCLMGHVNFGAVWWCKRHKKDVKDMEFYDGMVGCLTLKEKANKTLKSFKDMVTWLEIQGIKVTVWNGYKVVTLEEFLK